MNLRTADWLGVSLGVFGAGLVVVGLSCQLQKTADAGVPCTAPTPGTDACVLPLVAQDVAKAMTWAALSADAALRCGTDTQTVAAIWGAHVQAEVAEGFVPRMPVPGEDR